MTLIPAISLHGSQVVLRTAMHTLNVLEPGSMRHDIARYRKRRHSSSTDVAKGIYIKTQNVIEGMELIASVLIGRRLVIRQ